MVSTKITRTYYILSGIGAFTIGDCKFYVSPRYASRVLRNIEYFYSGTRNLIAVSKPGRSEGMTPTPNGTQMLFGEISLVCQIADHD